MRLGLSRWQAALLVVLAGWPVFRWYLARLTDGSDEPLGLLALAAAGWLAPREGWTLRLPSTRVWAACGALTVYAASFDLAPPLVRAAIWECALALVVVPSRRIHATDRGAAAFSGLAWWTLLLLSLPVVATLQFYLGFPLRVVTTQAAALVLKAAGLGVSARATMLEWNGERVLIDAPCSGIQMLWTLLFLGAVLAGARKLSTRETLHLFRRVGGIVFLANTLRAAALFCVEMRLWPSPSWAHDAIGLTLFGAAAWIVTRGAAGRVETAGPAPKPGEAAMLPPEPARTSLGVVCFLGLAVSAAAAPVWSAQRVGTAEARLAAGAAGAFPGWNAAPVPEGVRRRALTERDQRFADRFPGQIACFTDGHATWLVRWIAAPTRKLHPSTDCLRASGYAVVPGAAWQDARGDLWAGASATRDGEQLRIRERVVDGRGGCWTDVSAWYWDAAFARSEGPWWAVTVLEPVH